ncbi:MAG: hypothetical protein EOP22_10075 [Hyphomicrobiales bacterium]|nr:MAG: hypothetical protein EOP22_10075 [Hyphomicrobiales bacterium]
MLRPLAPLALALAATAPALAETVTVTAVQLPRFQNAAVGEPVQGLVFRGGLQLSSVADTFGGISGLGFVDDNGGLVAVSDRGNFIAGRLIYDADNHPLSLVGTTITAMKNSGGVDLPRAFARDAESMSVVRREGVPAAVRVGFENLTRVADFMLENGVPVGAAREISIPRWLTDTRTNESIEALCIAPDTSPVAGSTVIITEGVPAGDDTRAGWMLGNADKGPLSYRPGPGLNPTDCAFLPDGDLLVLERGVSLLAFGMRLVRVPAAEVKPEATLQGDVLLEGVGGDIDNMEAVAVYVTPSGETRIVIASDNNFNDWQRNVLLEFSLP